MKKFYAISLRKISKRKYEPTSTRARWAENYKEASRKLKVSPYAMRTYGHIVKTRQKVNGKIVIKRT